MSLSGFTLPTTDTAVSGSWTTPTNVQSKTDSNASATASPGKNTTASRDAGGFGLVIPTGAKVSKVEIQCNWKVDVTNSIATLRLNGKVSSTVLANHDVATEPTSFTLQNFDITADRAWVPADFADGTWFVRFNAVQGNSSNPVVFSFDYIETQVTYQLGGAQNIAIGSFAQSYSGEPKRNLR